MLSPVDSPGPVFRLRSLITNAKVLMAMLPAHTKYPIDANCGKEILCICCVAVSSKLKYSLQERGGKLLNLRKSTNLTIP